MKQLGEQMVGLLRKQRVAEGLGELVFCGTAEDWGYSSWWHFISRICGIRVSVDDGDRSAMSVNLPCLDQGLGCNKEHLVELERVVSESELWVQSLCLGTSMLISERMWGLVNLMYRKCCCRR